MIKHVNRLGEKWPLQQVNVETVVRRLNVTTVANPTHFIFGSIRFSGTTPVILTRMQCKLFNENPTAAPPSGIFLKLGDSTQWASFNEPAEFTQFGAASIGGQKQIVSFVNGDWVGRLQLYPVPISYAVIANRGGLPAGINLEIHLCWEFETL